MTHTSTCAICLRENEDDEDDRRYTIQENEDDEDDRRYTIQENEDDEDDRIQENEDDEDDRRYIIQTVCNHSFCLKCLGKWLKSKNTCPYCRHDLSMMRLAPVIRYIQYSPTFFQILIKLTKLNKCILNSELKKIKHCIDKINDINAISAILVTNIDGRLHYVGMTSLHVAAICNKLAVVKYLVEKTNVNVNAVTVEKAVSKAAVIQETSVIVVQVVIRLPTAVQLPTVVKLTAAELMASTLRTEEVDEEEEETEKDEEGEKTEEIETEEVEKTNASGLTPLQTAVLYGNESIENFLLNVPSVDRDVELIRRFEKKPCLFFYDIMFPDTQITNEVLASQEFIIYCANMYICNSCYKH